MVSSSRNSGTAQAGSAGRRAVVSRRPAMPPSIEPQTIATGTRPALRYMLTA